VLGYRIVEMEFPSSASIAMPRAVNCFPQLAR
jgi:hypothetical protein